MGRGQEGGGDGAGVGIGFGWYWLGKDWQYGVWKKWEGVGNFIPKIPLLRDAHCDAGSGRSTIASLQHTPGMWGTTKIARVNNQGLTEIRVPLTYMCYVWPERIQRA